MAVVIERGLLQTNPNLRFVVYAIVALLFAVAHVVVFQFVSIASITPDLLLILTVWIALREGQFTGLIAGFLSGLVLDLVSQDIPGTNALAKLVAGFVAGYFYREGSDTRNLKFPRFLIWVTLCGLVNNLIYFFFYLQPTEIGFTQFFLKHGVATTLYTTVISCIPMLIHSRKREYN